VTVRGPLQGQSRLCARILADLPEYFGLEDSNAAYACSADTLPSFVGAVDGRDVGLLLLAQTSDVAVELHLIAVLREFHRVGLGVHWFHVKTLAPRDPDSGYARTRAFYAAMGFEPLEEIVQVWGPDNPCLLLVKRL
jgi:GNAT superfamily N-acetyltransferase